MKQQVIRELTNEELSEKLEEQTLALTKMKINHAVSPLENPNLIKQARKDIARLKTEIRRRQLENNK
ncbi:MAG: 50S ribosomal protein L29 [Bacteroidetes bacterium]|nr:MAG: 50S ribosomal protein L29 [Bacteroidota bacterium]